MSDADIAAPPKRRAPRPRRVPRTKAAQAKLDAAAELFRPAPFDYDETEAAKPIDERIARWFGERGWQPFEFQREVWREVGRGASGLLHATTGAGKTWAVWRGALTAFAEPARFKKRAVKAEGKATLPAPGTRHRRNARDRIAACRPRSSRRPKASR